MENEILFTEKQRFNQWWLVLILLTVNGFAVYSIYKKKIVQNLPGDFEPWIALAITVLVTLLIFTAQLETRITKEGIYVRFFPFHITFRHYPWDAIKSVSVRKYNPIGEYGGWGIRFSRNGKALNISGNMGLQLEFFDNKKLLIGTKKTDDMKSLLEAEHLTNR